MIKLLTIPLTAYILLLPYAATVGSAGLGVSAVEEWIVICLALFLIYIIRAMNKSS